jgi:arginine/lysine/ornithine decarboxylase
MSVGFKPPPPERQPRLEHVRDLWQMHRLQKPQAILTAAIFQTDTGLELRIGFSLTNLIHSELSRTGDGDVDTLVRALTDIARHPQVAPRATAPLPPPLAAMAVIPRLAKFSPKRAVPVAAAVGKVSGETVSAYPPGSPVIAADEVVSSEIVEYLRCLHSHGASFKGVSDPSFQTLKVLDK